MLFISKEDKDDFYLKIPDKNSILKSCGVKRISKRGQKVYILECSVCSKDTELYPRGSITSLKDNLKKGKVPCGCAKTPSFSKVQDYILYKRNLIKYNNHRFIIGNFEKDYFCGRSFQTYSADLVIIGYQKDVGKKYKVYCKTCEGIFDTTKGHLKEGKTPCRCSKVSRYSLEEIERKICSNLEKILGNEDFKIDIEWKGNLRKSRVTILHDKECKNVSVKTSLKPDFKIGKVEDLRIPLKEWERRFNEESKGLQTLHEVTKRNFVYSCVKCSRDEYTLGNLCSGIYKTAKNKFLNGQRSCRCGNKNLTKEQKTFKVRQILEDESVCLCTIEGSELVKWTCPSGHTNFSVYSNIIAGKRCSICSRSSSGYYEGRCEEKDYLYIVSVSDKYYKVGRSFRPYKRIGEIRNQNPQDELEIVALYTGTHLEIYKIEQYILTSSERKGLRIRRHWTGELIDNKYLPEALDIIKSYVKSGEIKEVR